MHQERCDNVSLSQRHEMLLQDRERLKQATLLGLCSICSKPAHPDLEEKQLQMENARLKREIDSHIYNNSNRDTRFPQPYASPVISNAPPLEADWCSGTWMMMNERSVLFEQANAGMHELLMLGKKDSQFWRINSSTNRESFNYQVYKSVFDNGVKPPGYVMEASRETGVVLMSSSALVKTLMDTNKWADVFAPIVSIASTENVISTGFLGARSDSLQLIEAEFQVISPLVPMRKVKFLRYCKLLRLGLWAVVDVTPSQHNQDMLSYGASIHLLSGLIIEDMGNESSKVTWVEQAGYDKSHIHQLFQLLIGSGIGLGAKRWLTTLQRHCENHLTISSMNMNEIFPGLHAQVGTEILKLGRRMTMNYYSGITGSTVGKWQTIPVENEGQNMRVMIRKNLNEPGEQSGVVMSAATSVWLPVDQKIMFGFLSNLRFRNQWDILTKDTFMEEKLHIPKARRHENYVSLLRIDENDMLILQEMWNDASGALIVYAPVETSSIENIIRGGDSDVEQILPSGFSILPDQGNNNGGGCLLTLGFQILASSNPQNGEQTQRSIKLVQKLMGDTIDMIKSALLIPART